MLISKSFRNVGNGFIVAVIRHTTETKKASQEEMTHAMEKKYNGKETVE